MKKTILIAIGLFFSISSFSQKKDTVKVYKIQFDLPAWEIYLRNIDRLNTMAGRNVPNSEILLATKDTINAFREWFINQLNDSTINKK